MASVGLSPAGSYETLLQIFRVFIQILMINDHNICYDHNIIKFQLNVG